MAFVYPHPVTDDGAVGQEEDSEDFVSLSAFLSVFSLNMKINSQPPPLR